MRRGIATTLALLGAKPPEVRGDPTPDTYAAASVVSRILKHANDDSTETTWLAVADYLPLLAEAAPAQTLAALRSCLSAKHPFTGCLAEDDTDGLFGPSSSSALRGTLDAVETLAWSATHAPAAAGLLAEITAAANGSQSRDAARHGLVSIMCPWLPQTSADASMRLQTIDKLREAHPQIASDLLLTMLDHRSPRAGHPGPRYRAWRSGQPRVTSAEHHMMLKEVSARLVEDADEDPIRLRTLIYSVSQIPRDGLTALSESLARLAQAQPTEDTKEILWTAVRDMIASHRDYADTEWAIPEEYLARFEPLLDSLLPTSPQCRYGWLFNDHLVHIPEAHIEEDDAHEQALTARRTQAVADTLASHGLDGVLALATSVSQPHEVGQALARSGSDQTAGLIAAMHDADEAIIRAAFGYLRNTLTGWGQLKEMIDRHKPSPRTAADLLRALPPTQRSWRHATDLGADTAVAYWERADPYSLGFPEDSDALLEVSQGLRSAGRADDAAWVLHMGLRGTDCPAEIAEEIVECLQDRIDQQPSRGDVPSRLGEYRLSKLMDILDQHRDTLGLQKVALIEWAHYPELQYAHDFKAQNLYRLLSTDPEFYASLVELAYKPRSQDAPDLTETEQHASVNAWSILRHWPPESFCPGSTREGGLDADMLNAWVDDVRARLAAADRSEVGDMTIGAALAAAPPDPRYEHAPCAAVRDLIERLQSDPVSDGFDTALYNRMGAATTRGITDGGTIERDLAKQYRATSERYAQWPRTAAIFAGLASQYEHPGWEHRPRSGGTTPRTTPLAAACWRLASGSHGLVDAVLPYPARNRARYELSTTSPTSAA